MLKFIIGFISGIIIGMTLISVAESYYSGEYIWNRVFNSTTNTINVKGQ